MSGHNKWSKIHRQKGVADNKRGALFTKLGKAITIAARTGGGQPVANFRLQLAIDQARANNMPKDNIERAIKRGTGELEGGTIETVTYEGFGPGGVAFIIECLTDNRHRTAADIKHILTQHGGSFGGPNSVAWMFNLKGVVHTGVINADVELALIDAGATDIAPEDNGSMVLCDPASLKAITDVLQKNNLPVDYAQTEYLAKEKKPVDAATKEQLEKMFDDLDNNEDVDNFYTDAQI